MNTMIAVGTFLAMCIAASARKGGMEMAFIVTMMSIIFLMAMCIALYPPVPFFL